MTIDVASLRAREFPWTADGTIYLNHASTGPLPARTVAAIGAVTARRAEPWRLPEEELFRTLADARARCARLIGAKPAEIALQTNTSHGINVAARTLPLENGDVVLTFDREFPANVYPWMALERRGIGLRRVPCRGDLPDEEALLAALDFERVRCVTVSWVQFATGYRCDLARIGAACRERGIWFVVDAIQGLGGATLDVSELPVDVLACGAQKWLLGPWGAGFVYVREDLVRRLEPAEVGWMAVKGSEDFERLVDYDLTWHDDARRLEVGTLPLQELAGLSASLSLFEELGPGRVAGRIEQLATRIVSGARSMPGIDLVTPADETKRAGIVSVRPKDSSAASRRLGEHRVVHVVREGSIRLSPHVYNTDEEIDAALSCLEG